MKPQTYLHIPEPCHEDWNKMSQQEQGRYCQSCCKTVVDFELMTDQQILNYFANAKGNTCGRFATDQLNRPLIEAAAPKPAGWKWLMASVTSLLFMVNKGKAQGKVMMGKPAPPVQEQKEKTKIEQEKLLRNTQKANQFKKFNTLKTTIVTKGFAGVIIKEVDEQPNLSKPVTKGDSILFTTNKLQGTVTNEQGDAIAGAVVTINTGKGIQQIQTNDVGEFFYTHTLPLQENIKLSISSLGYELKEMNLNLDEQKLELHVQLKDKPVKLDDVTVVAYPSTRMQGYAMVGGINTVRCRRVTKADTAKTFINKMVGNTAFKMFPNPASKGKPVNITIQSVGEYEVQLLDNNSRLITTQIITTNTKQQLALFNLPASLPNGLYYVLLINKSTQKRNVDKLVVQ
jgi:hypothetical protein